MADAKRQAGTNVPSTGSKETRPVGVDGMIGISSKFAVLNGSQGSTGPRGLKGEDGQDGISVTHSWDGTKLTITSASGTSSADLRGPAGADADMSNYLPLTGGTLTGIVTFQDEAVFGNTCNFTDEADFNGNTIFTGDATFGTANATQNPTSTFHGNTTFNGQNFFFGASVFSTAGFSGKATFNDGAGQGSCSVYSSLGQLYFGNKLESETDYSGLLLWGETKSDAISDASILAPVRSGSAYLGGASRTWRQVYATNATIQTSDEREKTNILSISDYPAFYSSDNSGNIWEQFFNKLQPKTFARTSETEDKLHIGFIAQDIENAAIEVGIPVESLSLLNHEYWTDEETGEEKDRYGLAYEEFIALNTYMIKKLQAQIQDQQTLIESLTQKIEALENK